MEKQYSETEVSDVKPPKWWHEAVRKNLPGTMLPSDETGFASFTQVAENGVTYVVISLTADNLTVGLPEGIYLNTTIPAEHHKTYGPLIRPVALSFIKLLEGALPDEDGAIPIPSEINPQLASQNVMVDLRGSPRIGLFGQNQAGTLIFNVKQITMEDFKNTRNSILLRRNLE